MAWLIAIVCIILVVMFWRIFLPIAGVLLLIIALFGAYLWIDHDRDERAREARQRQIEERFARARSTSDTILHQWAIDSVMDPASGREAPRIARVTSDHGICELQVEERLDRSRLTGIYCPGLKVSPYQDAQVKFAERDTSDPMRLEYFTNYQDVYIPSTQYSAELDYDEFLWRLSSSSKVAIRLEFEPGGQQWVAFSLEGSGPALTRIGAIRHRKIDRGRSTY